MKKSFNFAFRHIFKMLFSLPAVLLLLTSNFSLPTFIYAQSGWGPDTRLTYFWGYSYDPRAACCGDTVHLVWWEHYGVSGETREEVFYKRSMDAGVTWGADVLLSVEDSQSSVLPEVAVSGNVVHVIWFDDDYGMLYRRSLDGSTTWQQIDSIIPGVDYSSIQAIGDTVYIAGITSSGGILKFTKSYDSGSSWLPIIDVTQARANPTLRLVSDGILDLVISYRALPGVCEIYSVLSFNGGGTWSDSQVVSDDDGIGSQYPAMDTDDSSSIHISWYDYKYSPYAWTGDIFYRASRDSGNSWEPIDSLTVMHRAVASDILAEGNNLHLVWEDDRNDFGNNFEIYYRMSSDLGQTWGSEARLTDTLNRSCGPSLACDGLYLHLFWFDLRDDPNNIVGEIYYKRKTLTGIRETDAVKYLPSGLSLDCPTVLSLRRNFTVRYDIGNRVEGEVKIMDITGRVLETFPVYGISGELVLVFNKEVCDGVYFIMLRAGEEYTTKKVLVVN